MHYGYIALVSSLLGLRILEAIRLNVAGMGVGLLPFGIVVGVFLVFATSTGEKLGMGRTRGVVFSAVRRQTPVPCSWLIFTILFAGTFDILVILTHHGEHQGRTTSHL